MWLGHAARGCGGGAAASAEVCLHLGVCQTLLPGGTSAAGPPAGTASPCRTRAQLALGTQGRAARRLICMVAHLSTVSAARSPPKCWDTSRESSAASLPSSPRMRSCSEQVFSKAVPIPRRGVWPRPSTAAMSNPSLSLLRWLQRLQSVGTSRYPRSVIMSPCENTCHAHSLQALQVPTHGFYVQADVHAGSNALE